MGRTFQDRCLPYFPDTLRSANFSNTNVFYIIMLISKRLNNVSRASAWYLVKMQIALHSLPVAVVTFGLVSCNPGC